MLGHGEGFCPEGLNLNYCTQGGGAAQAHMSGSALSPPSYFTPDLLSQRGFRGAGFAAKMTTWTYNK
jgi:hypothetical protein